MPDKKSFIQVVKFFWQQRKASPKLIWTMIAIQIVVIVMSSTIAPIFIARLLSDISAGTSSIAKDSSILIVYLALTFVGDVLLTRITIYLSFVTDSKISSKVAREILQKLLSKSLGFHAEKMSGQLISDANKLVRSSENFWDTISFNVLWIVITIISTCIGLIFCLWQYAVIIFVFSIIIIWLIIKAQYKLVSISNEVSDKDSEVSGRLADVVGNIATVKSFTHENIEQKKFNDLLDSWQSSVKRQAKTYTKINGTLGLGINTLNILVFLIAIAVTEKNLIGIDIAYLMITYTFNVIYQFWQVLYSTRNFVDMISTSKTMIDIIQEPDEVSDVANPILLEGIKGKIEFDDIKFRYHTSKHSTFSNFNLLINPGEQVGLVGRSGAGKSSLTRLLLRFSDVQKGKITIDDIDISKISQKNLRDSIAYVSQEPIMLHRSVKENIAYGKPNASFREIKDAARRAYASEFIEELPDKYNTLVGERGVKLSGGQKQRIAIARAILKNAPILILDEATSALDSESEKLIQAALAELMKNRTSIVIAHRLSTIAKLDRIVVMEDGKIIEDGNHAELLKKTGAYAKLWNHQFGGFLEE